VPVPLPPLQPVPLQPSAIVLHAHFLPARYRAAALAHGQAHPDGMPALPEWDAADVVAMMDDVGIAAAALSISSPGVSFLDSPAARASLTRAVNEDGAAAVAAYPDRFGLLASLPLPEIGAALAEIGHAFDVLGADGIGLHTHYGPVYLGDARLDPVMAALDARGALVTIHPASPCGWEQVSFGRPRPMVEFLFDTTRAVVNLALNGVLDRYPAIRWVVPHAGAALPVLADRVDRLYPLICPPAPAGSPGSAAAGSPPVDVIAALGRLYYDLAGLPLPRALPALLSLVEPGQIVYGSDYPFTPAATVRAFAEAIAATSVLDAGARAAVLRGNALGLLPRLAKAQPAIGPAPATR
jgi:predicted TIM-barrel fold metal-dependent hydrolase